MNPSDLSGAIPRKGFLQEKTFDFVVFGEGPDEQRLGFDEFCAMPLLKRVRLLLGQPPRFFFGEREISREEAMRFQG